MSRRASAKRDPVEQLADGLHSAAIHLLRRLRRTDPAGGLSPARLSALSVVAFGGPLRISDLARAEQVRTPTMTPIVAALEADGLITREADEKDARAAVLRATPKGQRLMAEGRARRVAALTAELRRLSAQDRRLLTDAVALMQQLSRGGPATE
jgi:DNA-binding MarR family transcriptional regulator